MALEILGLATTRAELEAHFEGRISRCAALLEGLLHGSTPRTRENTLEPLNEIYLLLGNAWNLAGLLRSVHPNSEVRCVGEESEKHLARFWNDLSLNRELYEVLRGFDSSGLDATGRRMVKHVLRDFHRSGVDREEPVREKVRQLRQDLVSIGQDFLRNILVDVRSITLDGREEMAGLPEDYVREHSAGPDGKIRITTDYPDYTPFMAYSHRSGRRKELYTEFRRRAYPANLPVLDGLLTKRHDLATILGYPTWASYVTEDKMIKSPAAVANFIERVSAAARPRAAAEYEELLRQKKLLEPEATCVNDWEKAYYEQRVRLDRYHVDSKEVRAYFEYTRVKNGILSLVEDLFGVSFRAAPAAPRWHPEVEVLDVFAEGNPAGRIYLDMHPREGKFKHAAMFPLEKGVKGRVSPQAVLVCNFPNPAKLQGPALLEHEDVLTFFHEFGHLLHHLFAWETEWGRFSGTATEWDFVEVPSQLFEEWAWEYDVLRRFAVHHATGRPIPEGLVLEMRKARAFGRALWVCHQLFYAALSLNCHFQVPATLDTSRLVAELQSRYSFFDFVDGTYFQASFGHLDDYSALYYTYMWSLAIEKDLFEEFRKHGIMDPAIASKYRQRILGPGGSRDAVELVRDFLGRDYSFEAFERWLGEEG